MTSPEPFSGVGTISQGSQNSPEQRTVTVLTHVETRCSVTIVRYLLATVHNVCAYMYMYLHTCILLCTYYVYVCMYNVYMYLHVHVLLCMNYVYVCMCVCTMYMYLLSRHCPN